MDVDQVNSLQVNTLLNMAGITSSSGGINTANIIANLIFGTIGSVTCIYGWKNKAAKPLVIGVALSIFPFFVSNILLIYGIGIALTALLYFWRD